MCYVMEILKTLITGAAVTLHSHTTALLLGGITLNFVPRDADFFFVIDFGLVLFVKFYSTKTKISTVFSDYVTIFMA